MNLVALHCQLHVACIPDDVTSNAEYVAEMYVSCVTSTTGPQTDVFLFRLKRLFLLFSEVSSSFWYILLAFTKVGRVLAFGNRRQRNA